jgi:hypothetical protein
MFYIYIILGILLIHCSIYYLNIDVFNCITQFKSNSNSKSNSKNDDNIDANLNTDTDTNIDVSNIKNDLSISIETSINELKNLNQYIDNELGQTTFC